MNWAEFKRSMGWKEIVATVKTRQQFIVSDLLDCTAEQLPALQAEFKTCAWFLTLPEIPDEEGEKDEEV